MSSHDPDKSSLPLAGEHREWTRRRQDAAALMWPSFVSAGVATTLFFAFFDPLLLGDISTPPIDLIRMTGYAWGFFLFWCLTFASSAVTLFLLRTATNAAHKNTGPDR